MTVTEIERTDRQDEAKPEPQPETEAGEQAKAFDPKEYDSPALALPYIDGEKQIDRIVVAFAGRVFLDRTDPRDVALYRRLRLGHTVDLKVQGKVSKSTGEGATDREGNLDVIVSSKTVKVDSLDIPAGEL